MAFLKGVKDEVWVHVTAVIDGDLGKKIKVPFKAKFLKLTVDEAKAVSEKCAMGEMTDDDVIREHLLGWEDLKGHKDEPVEFNDETLSEALSAREYRVALVDAYMRVQFGRSFDAKN